MGKFMKTRAEFEKGIKQIINIGIKGLILFLVIGYFLIEGVILSKLCSVYLLFVVAILIMFAIKNKHLVGTKLE